MIKINHDNYQAFFLDYIEGNLNKTDTDLLLSYLDQNPELKEELEDFQDITLHPNVISFEKESLYQTDFKNDQINHRNFEDFSIANLEKQLLPEKQTEFESYIKNDKALISNNEITNKTVLIANKNVVFNEKSSLKKEWKIIPIFWRIASAAAILLFCFLIYNNEFNSISSKVVINEKTKSLEDIINREKIINENHIQNNINLEHKESNNNLAITKDIKPVNNNLTKKGNANKEVFNRNLESIPSTIKMRNVDFHSTYSKSNSLKLLASQPYQYENFTSSQENNDNIYTPKEYLISLFKKKVLNTSEDNKQLTLADASNGLAMLTNNKINLNSESNSEVIVKMKNFEFKKNLD